MIKFRCYVDVYSWSSETSLQPTLYPIIPKPKDCIRYLITVDLPEYYTDVDVVLSGGVEIKGGKE